MNIEKLKEWMDFAQSCGEGDYWDQLFDEKNGAIGKNQPEKVEYPLVDIYQTGSEIAVLAELPGVRKEDISLSVSGSILHLNCHSRPADHVVGVRVRSERYSGGYNRQIQLPGPVDGAIASASLSDGLLTVRFRKAKIAGERIQLD